jgi:hypothetical protein
VLFGCRFVTVHRYSRVFGRGSHCFEHNYSGESR